MVSDQLVRWDTGWVQVGPREDEGDGADKNDEVQDRGPVLRNRGDRPGAQQCACGVDNDVVNGLHVMEDEVLAAVRVNNRKIHAEYAALAADKELAMKRITRAQDKQVKLKTKHKDMVRHHRRAERNFTKATNISNLTSTELESAISSGAEQGTLERLRRLAAISEGVVFSSSKELERLSEKMRKFDEQVKGARSAVEGMVDIYEELVKRQSTTNRLLERGDTLMDAVTEFMETGRRETE